MQKIDVKIGGSVRLPCDVQYLGKIWSNHVQLFFCWVKSFIYLYMTHWVCLARSNAPALPIIARIKYLILATCDPAWGNRFLHAPNFTLWSRLTLSLSLWFNWKIHIERERYCVTIYNNNAICYQQELLWLSGREMEIRLRLYCQLQASKSCGMRGSPFRALLWRLPKWRLKIPATTLARSTLTPRLTSPYHSTSSVRLVLAARVLIWWLIFNEMKCRMKYWQFKCVCPTQLELSWSGKTLTQLQMKLAARVLIWWLTMNEIKCRIFNFE